MININANINGAKRGLLTPPVPTGLTLTVLSDTSIKADVTTTFAWELWRSTTLGGTYTKVADVAKGTVTYTNTGLTAATEYFYKARAVNGSKYSEFGSVVSATTYHADSQVYFASMTTQLSVTNKGKINTLIGSLKTSLSISTIADGFDLFYLFANETSEAGLKNMAKRFYDATAVNSPTFAAYEGFTGNGSDNYLRTNYNPSTNANAFTVDSASMGIYSRSANKSDDFSCGYGTSTTGFAHQIWRNEGSNRSLWYTNELSASLISNSNGKGMYSASRTAFNIRSSYWNKTKATSTTNYVGIADGELRVLGATVGATTYYKNMQCAAFYVGKGFTETQINAIQDIIETWMDSNGKGVIV